MQQTRMNDMHNMGKMQRPIDTLGPAAIAAEEFSRARISHESFDWLFEIHAQKLAYIWLSPNRVYP